MADGRGIYVGRILIGNPSPATYCSGYETYGFSLDDDDFARTQTFEIGSGLGAHSVTVSGMPDGVEWTWEVFTTGDNPDAQGFGVGSQTVGLGGLLLDTTPNARWRIFVTDGDPGDAVLDVLFKVQTYPGGEDVPWCVTVPIDTP